VLSSLWPVVASVSKAKSFANREPREAAGNFRVGLVKAFERVGATAQPGATHRGVASLQSPISNRAESESGRRASERVESSELRKSLPELINNLPRGRFPNVEVLRISNLGDVAVAIIACFTSSGLATGQNGRLILSIPPLMALTYGFYEPSDAR
jgi:hypothetical protein